MIGRGELTVVACGDRGFDGVDSQVVGKLIICIPVVGNMTGTRQSVRMRPGPNPRVFRMGASDSKKSIFSVGHSFLAGSLSHLQGGSGCLPVEPICLGGGSREKHPMRDVAD